jgi:multidrug efflux pump subunit AcrA (membrane-fusion protein)
MKTSLRLITPDGRTSAPPAPAFPDQQISRQLNHAFLLITLLVGGFGGWGAIASISGAVVTQAVIAAQTKTNSIQHLDGGLVAEIFVKEGDFVGPGQPLLRLDDKDIAEELKGTESELQAKRTQLELDNKELASLGDLYEKGLVPRTRILTIERDASSLAGDIGRLQSQKGRALERSKRLLLKAPLAGQVMNLSVHTIGGVITPGKELMQIVPTGDPLVLDARIDPKDIEQVHVGQPVTIRLTGLNQRVTPELSGKVSVVSRDIVRDDQHNASYYEARVAFGSHQLEKIKDVELQPGMPAQVMIETGARSPISYLLKPLRDQIVRAFRED